MKWKVWMDLVACAEGILMMSLWTRVVSCCCCKCGTGGDDELADCHVSFCTCGSLTVGLLDTSLHLIVSYVCSDSS